ncbi:hypothetical protein INR49_030697 [Caranx melampygus]|nr:hypothetical protein INR49_030697 [Caranx melampygus]
MEFNTYAIGRPSSHSDPKRKLHRHQKTRRFFLFSLKSSWQGFQSPSVSTLAPKYNKRCIRAKEARGNRQRPAPFVSTCAVDVSLRAVAPELLPSESQRGMITGDHVVRKSEERL